MPSYTLEEFTRAIKQSPFYLASVHGVYELRKGRPSHTIDFNVPENAWVIEAATAGDVTSTEIDEHLWNFLQNRREFISYLLKQRGATDPIKKKVVNSLTIYPPGQKIFSRLFLLQEPEKDEWGWGYYKIPATGFDKFVEFPGLYEHEGDKDDPFFDIDIPNPPLTDFMRTLRNRHYFKDNETLRKYDYMEYNTKRFVEEVLSEEEPPSAVFIISACASLWGQGGGSTRLQKKNKSQKTKDQDVLIKRIENAQRNAQLQQAELGIASSVTMGNLEGEMETYTEANSNDDDEEEALRRVNKNILRALEENGPRTPPIGRSLPPKNTFLLFKKTTTGSFKPVGESGFTNATNTEWDMAWTDELFMEKIALREKDWKNKYYYEGFVPVKGKPGQTTSEILPITNKFGTRRKGGSKYRCRTMKCN
jgi:hypothetical protein